jgi:hypothetical protein
MESKGHLLQYGTKGDCCCYRDLSISICIHSFGLDLSSIQVAQDEDLAFQIGKEIHFDLVDHDKVRSFRVQKQTLFSHFKVRPFLY